jgi:hypothetical protein
VSWLGEIVVGAFLDRFDGGFDRALRGEDDDREVAAFVLHRTQQVEAAHARHDEVADDNGGSEGGDFLKRFFAVGGGVRHESPGAHELGEPEARGRFIFHYQHAFARDIVFSHLVLRARFRGATQRAWVESSLSFLHGPAQLCNSTSAVRDA